MKFNLADLPEQNNNFEPLPPGWYPVTVESGEWKTSKSNSSNEYLNLKLRVQGDNYANRVVFHMLNLINTNEVAKNIALHDLKDMFIAMGADKDKLKEIGKDDIIGFILDKPFKVKLNIKKDTQWGDKNEIKGFDVMNYVAKGIPTPSDCPF